MDTNIIIENLAAKKTEMEALHEEVYSLFIEKNVQGPLKNEYNNKITQYESMYSSLEMMKNQMKEPSAAEGLINHQMTILAQRIEFEQGMKERFLLIQ